MTQRKLVGVPDAAENRYFLYAVGPSIADTVWHAGGWLFDRAMAGWNVTAFVPEMGDTRALRILGVEAADSESLPALLAHCPGRIALAVVGEVFGNDDRIRGLVLRALNSRSCEVTFFGGKAPAGLSKTLAATSHRLSPAAAAFKKHALNVTKPTAVSAVEDRERFFSYAVPRRAATPANPRVSPTAQAARGYS
jgi:hypothetical protein